MQNVFGVTEGLTSNFIPVLGPVSDYDLYPTLNTTYYIEDIIWKLRSNKFIVFEDLYFYGFPDENRVPIEHIDKYLILLQESPFPTLYSTQNEYEFFAELFFSYIHCVIQKRPYEYRFRKPNGDKIETLNGFLDGRCEQFKVVFDELFIDTNKNSHNQTAATETAASKLE